MLSLDPQSLSAEIQKAEDFRKKHTERSAELHKRFATNWYREDLASEPSPENHIFGYVAFMLPELAYAEPSCRVTAKRQITHKPIAEYMQMFVRTWLGEVEFASILQDVVRDMLLGFGVIRVGMADRNNTGKPNSDELAAMQPTADYLEPERFLMDPACLRPELARWMGHSYWRDLDELLGDPRYDQEAVSQLVATNGTNPGQSAERAMSEADIPNRRRVELIDLWIRDSQQICTLARFSGSPAGTFIRPPQPYYGHERGPYEVFGFYRVKGDPYPIGPLQACMEQFEDLQAHLTAESEEASGFKNLVLVDANNVEARDSITNAKNNAVVAVKNLQQSVVQVQLGAIHPQRMQHSMNLRNRFDATLGYSDAQRGRAVGKTATETNVVQSNVDGRTDYMRQRVKQGVAGVLRRVGWYAFYSPLVAMPVSGVDPFSGQPYEGLFLGGPQQGTDMNGNWQDGQENVHWVDFNLDVEPTSLQRSDDTAMQQRWLQTLTVTQQVAQAMVTMPWVNWRFAYDRFGESINQNRLSEFMFNMQALQMFGQLPQMFGLGQPATLPGTANQDLFNRGLGIPTMGGIAQGVGPAGFGASGMSGQMGGGFGLGGSPGNVRQQTTGARPPQQAAPRPSLAGTRA